jgi:TonB family protein
VARKRKITGQATVQFIVHENGQVRDAHLIKSLADAFTTSEDRTDAQTLYQKAIEAVYHYQLSPATFLFSVEPMSRSASKSMDVLPTL